jgi:transcriptional regulator NrdR family protein
MTCPACRRRKLSVTETTDLGDRTQRTRRCDCGARFYTVELFVPRRAAMADLVAVPRSVLELIEEAARRTLGEAVAVPAAPAEGAPDR